MANIFLNPDEIFGPLGGENSVFGSTGSETLLIREGGNFTIDATIEEVELPGELADFAFQTVGTSVEIQTVGSGDVVAIFNDVSNTPTVVFRDGSAEITPPQQVGGPALLGGTEIPDLPSQIIPDIFLEVSLTSDFLSQSLETESLGF